MEGEGHLGGATKTDRQTLTLDVGAEVQVPADGGTPAVFRHRPLMSPLSPTRRIPLVLGHSRLFREIVDILRRVTACLHCRETDGWNFGDRGCVVKTSVNDQAL